MTETAGGFVPLHPAHTLTAETLRLDYAPIADRHHDALAALVDIAAREAALVGVADKEHQKRFKLVSWVLDGDITDGRFDTATRLQVDVSAAPKDKNGAVPADVFTPDVFVPRQPNAKVTNQLAKIGLWGAYLYRVAWQTVPLVEVDSPSASGVRGSTCFLHLATGRRYLATADPDNATHLEPLPTYQTLVEQASTAFALDAMGDILSGELLGDFGEAADADQKDTVYRGDNLVRYKELSRDLPANSTGPKIRQLLDMLKNLDLANLTPSVVSALLEPDIVQTAELALVGRRLFTQNPQPAYHMLHWAISHARLIQSAFAREATANQATFQAHLEAGIDRTAAVSRAAEELGQLLLPPHAISVQNRNDWDIFRP
ncbi:MAG TPA: hypothetical protein VLH84_00855 [Patescibacteria group bacterium]|nr:hypothetical protein [Patescibacteria group bacterium]